MEDVPLLIDGHPRFPTERWGSELFARAPACASQARIFSGIDRLSDFILEAEEAGSNPEEQSPQFARLLDRCRLEVAWDTTRVKRRAARLLQALLVKEGHVVKRCSLPTASQALKHTLLAFLQPHLAGAVSGCHRMEPAIAVPFTVSEISAALTRVMWRIWRSACLHTLNPIVERSRSRFARRPDVRREPCVRLGYLPNCLSIHPVELTHSILGPHRRCTLRDSGAGSAAANIPVLVCTSIPSAASSHQSALDGMARYTHVVNPLTCPLIAGASNPPEPYGEVQPELTFPKQPTEPPDRFQHAKHQVPTLACTAQGVPSTSAAPGNSKGASPLGMSRAHESAAVHAAQHTSLPRLATLNALHLTLPGRATAQHLMWRQPLQPLRLQAAAPIAAINGGGLARQQLPLNMWPPAAGPGCNEKAGARRELAPSAGVFRAISPALQPPRCCPSAVVLRCSSVFTSCDTTLPIV